VAVALGAAIVIAVPVSAGVDTSSPDTTDPASPARERWLSYRDSADADTFAGGARLRDLVVGARVLMIGDSIMASTSSRYGGEMCKELVPRGWDVEVDAESGRFVEFGGRVLDARLDAGWDAAVVMLGNNYGADKAVFHGYLDDIVDRLAPRPTVLLTVTEFRPDRADVNDAIYDVAAEHDNVRVVDWAGETASEPDLVGGDGLHLSDLGRARYADLVGSELGWAPGVGEGDCLGSSFTDDSAVSTGTQPGQVAPPSPPPSRTGGAAPPVTPAPTAAPTVPPTVAAPEVPTTPAPTPTTVAPTQPPPPPPPTTQPPPPPTNPPPTNPPPTNPPPPPTNPPQPPPTNPPPPPPTNPPPPPPPPPSGG
jgi:hypothetical protein